MIYNVGWILSFYFLFFKISCYILNKHRVLNAPSVQSQVDIAYAPFIERYQPFLLDVKKYNITEGRPQLATWIQVLIKFSSTCKLRIDLPGQKWRHKVSILLVIQSLKIFSDPPQG